MKRLSITTRMAAIMAIPLVVIVAAAVLSLRAADERSDVAEATLRRVEQQASSGELAGAIAAERRASLAAMAGGDGAELADAEAALAEARAVLDAASTRAGGGLVGRGTDAAFQGSLAALAGLGEQRAAVDSGGDPVPVARFYSDLVDTYLVENERLDRRIEDEDLAAVQDRYLPLVRHRESVRRTADLATMVRQVPTVDPAGARQDLVRAIGGAGVHAAELRSVDDELTERYEQALSTPAAALFESGSGDVLAGTSDDPSFAAWRAAADTVDADLAAIERDAVEAIRVAADGSADSAASDRRLVLAVAGIAALLAVAISALVALSITRPLARLTEQATKAAEDLPKVVESVLVTPAGEEIDVPTVEQVDVRAGGEIEQVARALNAVQNTAVELAVEQARMRRNVADTFVNLGRRNQNLIGRQLEYLTRLEQDETDPDTLDHLFHLDHLATRARRNAESLLVLAGLEPPRTWDRPVSVADVLRGALGEVEHYERVGFGRIDDARLVGSAVAPVMHLLAELVENALSFSPPKERVGLVGRWVGSVYMVAVVDRGIGMTGRDMELANRRLAGDDTSAVSPSKYLGHHVAGELARRLGAEVRLEAGRTGGLVARVMLPAALMVEPAPDLASVPGDADVEDDAVTEALAAATTETARQADAPSPIAATVAAPATAGVPLAEADNVHQMPAGSRLARRRPGASMPVTDVVTGFDGVEGAGDEDDGGDAPRTAEQVRSMLSSFSAGVQRGRDRSDRSGEGEP